MLAVNLDRVSVTYVNIPIFTNLSWEIHDNRVVGLVGPNGSGKSTLLKLITGEVQSATGFTVRKKGLRIGCLDQHPALTPGLTVFDETLLAVPELHQVEINLLGIEERLADPSVYNNEKALTQTLERQAHLLAEYDRLGGATYTSRVRSTLFELGFTEADLSLPVEVLSGGQIKLVGLARLLVNQPDLLLLDEPDNHLDLVSKGYLERTIRSYPGAVVIVSHDRYLFDLIVDEIVEIEDGHLTLYSGNYSEYAYEKQLNLARQQVVFKAQQKEIHRLEDSAKRLLMWGRVYDNNKFIRRGQSILKRLDKIERIDKPVLDRRRMALQFSGWTGSTKVLELRRLTKTFPAEPSGQAEKTLFNALDLVIQRGERVGLIGPNGAGKSVLFRIILEQEAPTSGEVIVGPSVKIGYYAQHHETLDPACTLIDTVSRAMGRAEEHAVAFLGKFLFTYRQSRTLIGELSGGERSRLQLALLMLSGANFLLLDEPTNHLDIPSAEVLENSLEDFEGTVLVISHDRYFLDQVVDRIIELDDQSLVSYPGSYSDYEAAITARR